MQEGRHDIIIYHTWETYKKSTFACLLCPCSKYSDVDLIYPHVSSHFVLNHLSIHHKLVISYFTNKRPTGLNDHLSIRDSTLISCRRTHINFAYQQLQHRIKKINNGIGKQNYNPLLQQQSMSYTLIE